MQSNFETRRRACMCMLNGAIRTGNLRFATMELASIPSLPSGSSSSFNVCTPALPMQAPASGWRSAKRSSTAMAGGSGSSLCPNKAPSSISLFPIQEGNMMTKLKAIDILLVEDNPGDVRLTQEALLDAKVRNSLHVVHNGVEALAFLRHTGKYAQEQYPDLILLDLNLPQMSGSEVLEQIKGDEKLRRIPVVVLTTSQAEQDILRSYNLHANAYVVKPVDLEQFIVVVKS